ncbi:MAG: histidine phosphatase family protein [Deltaproteobacteria bacterium]|jgi:broad specificity phosphatase PhoE|nr:histidine phosphatase family protein [Deltaproteobacteria bacterium]
MAALRKVSIIVLLLCSLPMLAEAAESDLGQWVGQADHIIMLRHARAPGIGDPANFRLGDCSTQRNLSRAGKEQAARIGKQLRMAGLADTTVYSSQWCRCLETARNLAVGPIVELPLLDSFFQSPELERRKTEALRSWIASADLTRPVVLVTHQVNITALTGIVPAEGEILILHREQGKLSVVARFSDN